MYHWINTITNNNITTNHQLIVTVTVKIQTQLEMWANAQRDGCPIERRCRPLLNAAKFG